MASLLNRLSRFARSPQGKRLARKAQDFASSPEGKRKIADARRRFARKG